MAAKTLIFASLPEEADAVHPSRGIRFVCGPFAVRTIDALKIATCGLGKVNAAMAVGRLATEETQLVAMERFLGTL